MSDVTRHEPAPELYDLGIIDEYGNLRILIGKQFLSLHCLRSREMRSSESRCNYLCSNFSGPSFKRQDFHFNGETKCGFMVTLMCSGRTLYFKRFINLLDIQKSDKPLDFSDMSDDEILKELGFLDNVEMPE